MVLLSFFRDILERYQREDIYFMQQILVYLITLIYVETEKLGFEEKLLKKLQMKL